MITLANGTGSGAFAAPKPLPGSDARSAAHRQALLEQVNRQLIEAEARAQAQLDAAARARQQQAAFLAIVAHELRRPLTPIRTAATMLGRIKSDDPDTLARLQAIIERQVVHLARLVDDLLDLSRSGTGKLRLERMVVDLVGIVGQAAEACRATMRRRDQRLTVLAPVRPLEVDGDPVRLAQVLGNLLDNASKFTPDGGAIELLVAAADADVVLIVSDSGVGIAPETLPHVFEPFAQGSPARGGDGLGLGLAVVRELVEAHDGQVVAQSAGKGCGSRFVVTLPRLGSVTALAPEARAAP